MCGPLPGLVSDPGGLSFFAWPGGTLPFEALTVEVLFDWFGTGVGCASRDWLCVWPELTPLGSYVCGAGVGGEDTTGTYLPWCPCSPELPGAGRVTGALVGTGAAVGGGAVVG